MQDLSSQLWLRQRCDGDHVLVSGVVDEAHKIKFLLNSRPLELQEAERSDDESIFRYVEKEEWSRVLKTTAEAVKQKQARTVVIRSANLGAILDMNITFQPIFDGFGKVKEYAFVLHDLKPVEKSADSSIKLKIWMAKRDINASQLAAATGITPQTISKLRNGKIIRPHRLTAELIAAELRVDVSDIWTEVRN
ncbi:helix-turn-helix domain-containing protein [Paenibacillus thailandensis]|uniref:Helix-turn-helix domain-containing protein n=1 Tax=Paenibacillus thailandensis TaxID=393250 RepID=A0ABW5QYZ4_9BACL